MYHAKHHSRKATLAVGLFTPLLALTGTVACGDDSAGPDQGADVEEITDNDYFSKADQFVGDTVTVSAAVTDVLTPQSFQLAGDEWGDESLLVTSAEQANVQEGTVVRVTGQVAEPFVYGKYANDYGLGDAALYDPYDGEKFLIAENVTTDVPQEPN